MAKRNRSTFERLQRGEMLSRRERKQIERQLQAEDPGWEIANDFFDHSVLQKHTDKEFIMN